MSAIGPGDLVVIVKSCCARCSKDGIGTMFTVKRVFEWSGMYCAYCNNGLPAMRVEPRGLITSPTGITIGMCPLAWLKKIEPPKQEEGEHGRTTAPVRTTPHEVDAEQEREVVSEGLGSNPAGRK